ncbi:MAG: hypothetical protein ABII94_04640, partial [Patescibacteria group bacterium]
ACQSRSACAFYANDINFICIFNVHKIRVDIGCPKNKKLNSEASEFSFLFFGHRMSTLVLCTLKMQIKFISLA